MAVGSGAACLAAPQARSRARGFHYLGSKDGSLMSGSVAATVKAMVSAAAPAQLAAPAQATLEELGHPQPSTPMKAGSTTASGIINGTVR